jgi:chemotaxis protein CheX
MVAPTLIDHFVEQMPQIVHDVFLTMLGLAAAPLPEAPPAGTEPMTAAIYFAGAWKGAVLFECDAQQAREITRRLMPDVIDDEDEVQQDALGEITNMLGGNLKSLMPPGTSLSLPSVVEGSNYSLRICGDNRFERLAFATDIGPIMVTMVEVQDAPL